MSLLFDALKMQKGLKVERTVNLRQSYLLLWLMNSRQSCFEMRYEGQTCQSKSEFLRETKEAKKMCSTKGMKLIIPTLFPT